MLNKNKAQKILDQAIKKSSYENIEVYLWGGKNHLTRFAKNSIHQNVVQKNYSLTVKVTEGKKIGIANCNIFDGKNLENVVKEAEKLLKYVKDDDSAVLPQPPEKESYKENDTIYDKKTSETTPAQRASKVAEIISLCEPENISSSGTIVTGDNMFAYMNSKNRFGYSKRTYSDFTLTLTNKLDGTSYESASSNKFSDIDFSGITKKAIERSILNKNPTELAPGKYTVILEEMAVTTLLDFLAYMGFGGLQYLENRSFMKLGEKITGSNITITDNPYNKVSFGMPFDFEGTKRLKVSLIEKGIAKNVVHDLKTASALKTKSTGHALSPGSSMGPFPLNLEIKQGSSSDSSLLKSVQKGILITRFFYSNIVNRNTTTITGMTRDGTFLIEDGKITKPVVNMRYNENILDALSRVRKIGKSRKLFQNLGGINSTIVPKLLIDDFNFTGISKL